MNASRIAATLAALSLALVAAGCGDSGSSTSSGSTDDGAAMTTMSVITNGYEGDDSSGSVFTLATSQIVSPENGSTVSSGTDVKVEIELNGGEQLHQLLVGTSSDVDPTTQIMTSPMTTIDATDDQKTASEITIPGPLDPGTYHLQIVTEANDGAAEADPGEADSVQNATGLLGSRPVEFTVG